MKHKWAREQFALMSEPVKQFVRELYAVRDDHIALAHTFDTKRPPNTAFKLWEASAIADVVRSLPANWE
jgi:hypothetical protein